MPLDARALHQGCHEGRLVTGRQFCRAELGQFRELAATGTPITMGCAQEVPLFREAAGDDADVRRIDPESGEVLERLEMPPGVGVSGLESDGGERFYCGGGGTGKLRAIRRPKRG